MMEIDLGVAILISGLVIGMGLAAVGSAIRSISRFFSFSSLSYEVEEMRKTIQLISKELITYERSRIPRRPSR